MHDGRYTTLQECLEHYNSGIVNTLNLDPLIPVGGMSLTVQDKNDIISFLNTLTDPKFLNDKRFSDPNFQ
jgi:cytochrome c peroxidase